MESGAVERGDCYGQGGCMLCEEEAACYGGGAVEVVHAVEGRRLHAVCGGMVS